MSVTGMLRQSGVVPVYEAKDYPDEQSEYPHKQNYEVVP